MAKSTTVEARRVNHIDVLCSILGNSNEGDVTVENGENGWVSDKDNMLRYIFAARFSGAEAFQQIRTVYCKARGMRQILLVA